MASEANLEEAAAMEELAKMFDASQFNGPTEAGIAAGAELTKITSECLVITDDHRDTIVSAYRIVKAIPARYMQVKRALMKLAIMVKRQNWFDAESHVTTVMTWTYEKDELDLAMAFARTLQAADEQNAVTIAVAGKVNFYQTNHHVGQRQFQGYMLKVMTSLLVTQHDEAVYSATWKATHWLSTKQVLGSCGVAGLPKFPTGAKFPSPAEDVKLRLESFPSGTAKLALVVAILERAAMSVYEGILTLDFDPEAVYRMFREVQENPIRYHTGARALVGDAALARPVVPEEALQFAAAFIHAVAPGSTLSKGKALPAEADVKASMVYQSLKGVIDQIRAEGLKDEEKLRKVRIATGTGNGIKSIILAAKGLGNALPTSLPAQEE